MKRVLDLLKKARQTGQLSHAYLFVGSPYADKLAVAKQFADLLGCQSTDLVIVEPDIIEKDDKCKEGEIGFQKIKDLQYWANLTPPDGQYKLAIINSAEKISREAANALLKTLEEPSARVIFILITVSSSLLLPTVVSRCQIIKFPSISIDDFFKNREMTDKKKSMAEELAGLAGSNLAEKFKWAEGLAKDTILARERLSFWLLVFRDLIVNMAGGQAESFNGKFERYSLNKLKNIIKRIKETDKLLSNSSINARLALEVLMLEI